MPKVAFRQRRSSRFLILQKTRLNGQFFTATVASLFILRRKTDFTGISSRPIEKNCRLAQLDAAQTDLGAVVGSFVFGRVTRRLQAVRATN
jgi:hypothetical protein